MAGCFGSGKYDSFMEDQLMRHLNDTDELDDNGRGYLIEEHRAESQLASEEI